MPTWSPLKPISEGKPLDRIQRATCTLVLAKGIDEVSVSAAIQASEVSRRTFYSYYESVAAVLADVWLYNGFDWLESLGTDGGVGIGSDLERILIYCLAISHRIEELQEVIADDFQRIWQQLEESETKRLSWAWQTALTIGHGLHLEAGVAPSGPELKQLVAMLRESDLSAAPSSTGQVSFEHGPIEILDEDQTTQRLLNATVAVVGKSGAVKANVLRICRRAKVSAGALVGRFASPDEVVTVAFQRILSEIVRQNMSGRYQSDRIPLDEWYAASIKAGLGANRSGWRKFRREIVIASCHSLPIKKQAVESLTLADQPLSEYLANTKLNANAQRAATCFNREISEGLAILLDLGVPVDQLNHVAGARLVLKWLGSIG